MNNRDREKKVTTKERINKIPAKKSWKKRKSKYGEEKGVVKERHEDEQETEKSNHERKKTSADEQ